MARFVFRLEPVLRQREILERERQREVAAIEARRLLLEAQLRERQRGIEQERADLRERVGPSADGGGSVINLAHVRVQANASLKAVHEAQALAIDLAGVCARLDAARARLVEASAAKKALEKLRERQREAWLDASRRREAQELDEISVLNAGRRGRLMPAEVTDDVVAHTPIEAPIDARGVFGVRRQEDS